MLLPSNSSLHPQHELCVGPEVQPIMESLLVVYVFLLPLFLYVVAVGYQRWRKDGFMAPFTTWSHIDIFTYNVVFLDLLNTMGSFSYFLGVVTKDEGAKMAGSGIFAIFISGQTLFHLLTCMEHYLAVVHPIYYLRLKGSAGARPRNITVGCVWLISILLMVLIIKTGLSYPIINGLLLFFTSIAFGFCSLSVLCALIRPGPGRTRNRVDQSKKRALQTIMIITVTFFLRFMSNMISSVIQSFGTFSFAHCMVGWSSMWFFVPSSLVLPLLLLQRAGKLPPFWGKRQMKQHMFV